MRIIRCEHKKLVKVQYLYEALEIDINKKNIISFVGGGGKTTSIYILAKEISSLGKTVVVITTTHMSMPKENIVLEKNIDIIKEVLDKKNMITVGSYVSKTKIGYIGDNIASKIIDICDILLVEADGAKMLPFKAPASHEPVIFEGSNIVVGIAGIDALGRSIYDICHRPEIVSEILNVNMKHNITEADIAYILSSDIGQKKNVNSLNAEYRAIINKVDSDELLLQAEKISVYLSEKNIKSVITSYLN